MVPWTFLTNHAMVLICIAEDVNVRMRMIANAIGITERAVQRIIADLEKEGFVEIVREGRRNRYTINRSARLMHKMTEHKTIGQFLDFAKKRA